MSRITFFSEHPSSNDDEDDDDCEDEDLPCNGGGNKHPHSANANSSALVQSHSSASSFIIKPEAKRRKMTRGKQKIPISFMHDRVRRCSTFSKRKTGLMKKAFELAELTGAEVMLLVASETNHVYTFTTNRLKPMVESETGRELIQSCLKERKAYKSPPHNEEQEDGEDHRPPSPAKSPSVIATTPIALPLLPPLGPTNSLSTPTTAVAQTVSFPMLNGSVLHFPLPLSELVSASGEQSGGADSSEVTISLVETQAAATLCLPSRTSQQQK